MITRPSGGDFDPVSASVWGPNRVQLASGETVLGEPVLILRTRIKSPQGLFTREQTNQGHSNSQADMWIDVRIEGGGDRLTSDMWMIHRGTRYDIKGILGLDWRKGLARYQVTMSNDFSRIRTDRCDESNS